VQIVDFVYACILMSWVPKTLANYSWCENDDFQWRRLFLHRQIIIPKTVTNCHSPQTVAYHSI